VNVIHVFVIKMVFCLLLVLFGIGHLCHQLTLVAKPSAVAGIGIDPLPENKFRNGRRPDTYAFFQETAAVMVALF